MQKYHIFTFWRLFIIHSCFANVPNLTAQELHWKHFGNLREARYSFGAVAISPTEVLVMGGLTGEKGRTFGKSLRSCEIIDVRRGTISPAAEMNVAHAQMVVLQAKDSNVIVVSGADSDSTSTPIVELYDRQQRRWKILGSLFLGRKHHAATFINDHEILVVGGNIHGKTTIAECEIFNMITGKSQQVADFPQKNAWGICSFSEIFCSGTAIFITGRSGGGGSYTSSQIYQYKRHLNQWELQKNYPVAVYASQVIKIGKSLLIAGGGSYATIKHSIGLETASGFIQVGQLIRPTSWGGIAQWSNELVVVMGGIAHNTPAQNHSEWFDLKSQKSLIGPTMLSDRESFSAISLPEFNAQQEQIRALILAIGGLDEQHRPISSIEILETRDIERIETPIAGIKEYRFQKFISSPTVLLPLFCFVIILVLVLVYLVVQIIFIKTKVPRAVDVEVRESKL